MSMMGQVVQSFSNMLSGNSAATSTNPVTPPANTPAVATTPTVVTPPAVVESPLDPYATLWEPVTVDPNAPAQLASASTMFAGMDPKQMLDAARKVNFANSIPPEVLAKITAGGAEAAGALTTVLNDVGQRAYAQASMASVNIVQKALERFEQIQQANLPNQFRGLQVSDAVTQANSAFAHPAFAPVVDMVKSQMMIKFPNASPVEIAKMAVSYLDSANQMANPIKPVAPKAGEVNWMTLASNSH